MKLKNQLLRQLVFSLVNRQFYGIISERKVVYLKEVLFILELKKITLVTGLCSKVIYHVLTNGVLNVRLQIYLYGRTVMAFTGQ